MKRRTLSSIMALVLVLGMALTLATPVGAATPTFTGDVPTDFTGPGMLTIPDPGGVGDVGVPVNAPPGTVSGWDMVDLRLTYDAAADTLYVGINTFGIAGDADGDGNPGGTSAWLATNQGTDIPNLGSTETIAVYFDLNQDGTFDVIAGVSGNGTDITGFTVANFSGNPWNPAYAFGTPLPTHTGSYHANPSGADPDFDFTILNFSTLPGQDALLAGFRVWAFMGSIEDDGIGEDSIQYEQSPSTITTITSSAAMVVPKYGQSPSTITATASSAAIVVAGGSVNLTVTEENTGDDPLINPRVEVRKNGTLIDTLVAPPDSGDNGNGILDPGETWRWTISSGSITAATTFVALGFGTDSLGNEVSYAEGNLGERDEVTVDTIEPDTITTITASETKVLSGGSVDLTVTEENTGDDPLTNPRVEVRQDGTLIHTLVWPPDSGDNGNGILDPGETWTWTRSSDPITAATTFEALGFGTDSLGNEVSDAKGYKGERDEVTVEIECTGCLKICKYEEKTGNHRHDAGEPWLSGWVFNVTDSQGNFWNVTTVGDGGRCGGCDNCETPCLDLPSGEYTVTEILQDGWTCTTDNPRTVRVECDKTEMVYFGNREGECTGCLKICKYEDKNDSGTKDGDEPWLSGWVFNVTDSQGNFWNVTTVGDGGRCGGCDNCETPCLDLPSGEYTVTEILQDGWTCTTDNPRTVRVECDKTEMVYFGNREGECQGCLKICKYEEKTGNHQHDAGEPWLSGWVFNVTDSQGNFWNVTTVGDGGYCGCDRCDTPCLDLPAGDYNVTETVKAGWVCTTGNPRTVTVECGKTEIVYFGNREGECSGCLKICKYEDKNDSGTKDTDEPYLSGWEFTVTDSDGNSWDVTTVGDGGYCGCDKCETPCLDLPAGDYNVTETVKAGWVCTTGNPRTVTVECGKTEIVYFGNREGECQGCLKICKYEDTHNYGTKDTDEPYLSGWEFTVTDSDGNSWDVTTVGDGGYCGCDKCETPCLDLPAGDYNVTETVKAGWVCTTGNPRTVTVECGTETPVEFGNRQECIGCLKIYKYEDKDGHGTFDPGRPYYESYLSGWEFTVTDIAGNSWSGTTNSYGYVQFCDLPAGEYTITETLKDGWTCTTDNPLTATVVCYRTTRVYFGNREGECSGCLKICKYEDKNNNQQKDRGESYLSGWEFTITNDSGYSKTVTTGGSGGRCGSCDYCVTVCDLVPGEYTITETLKDGWTCTTDNPLEVTVECGKETKADFGNRGPCTGCLKIYKYNDRDGDGTKDRWERYLANWEFTVTDAAGNSWSGTTSWNGYVTICNLPIGDYTITETLKDGWTCITDNPFTVTVVCDEITRVYFGNKHERY